MERGDQRRHTRAVICGVARVAGPGPASELLAVRDLSAGGMRLDAPPGVPAGQKIALDVRVLGETMAVLGTVAWASRHGGRAAMGVQLARPADVAESFAEVSARLATRGRRGVALLVESDLSRAALLAEYLWSHGYEVEEAPAPLPAIARLAEGDVALVAIGPRLSTCSGGEFAAFVAESFPRVHRMVVASTARGTSPMAAVGDDDPMRRASVVVCDEPGCRRSG